MRIETPLTRMLGIDVPICQAGMGTIAYHELAAAVTEAGGLGAFGGIDMTVEELDAELSAVKALTSGPVCVDLGFPLNAPKEVHEVPEFKIPGPIRQLESELRQQGVEILPVEEHAISRSDNEEKLEVCLDHGVAVIAAALGTPEWVVERCHSKGVKVMSIVGQARHAQSALRSGTDVIVAQGYEGGGHTGDVGLMTLLAEILDMTDVPVVAAGGIATGRQIAGLLTAGASGVWIGTQFVATSESRAEVEWKQRIVESKSGATIRSLLCDGLYHRQLRNRATEVWEGREDEILPYPEQRIANAPNRRAAHRDHKIEYMTLGAGQSASLVNEIPPAGAVVERLSRDTVRALMDAQSLLEGS